MSKYDRPNIPEGAKFDVLWALRDKRDDAVLESIKASLDIKSDPTAVEIERYLNARKEELIYNLLLERIAREFMS